MKLLWIIMACYTLKTTISTGSVNSTGTDVADKVALGQDVFRQLLNQETLIRIDLVKHVHSLMQEMVTLKDNTLKLQNSLDEILIRSKEDMKSTQRDIKALKLENQILKETLTEIETVLKEQNETDIKINNAISNLHKDQQRFERQMNGNLDSLERNVTGALSGINVNMRLLSMAVVNVDKRSNDLSKRLGDVNQSIPELIEEKGRMVSEIVRNMSEHL
ncbi:uncharacterized protein LOC130053499 [Ostrea edulis]|uniref:uncharacterized protein LOC130053499 n=1 Tax=Ostrea edulis TaxID=37623 RepID=UPI0024AFA0D2|nr:uncharacterized protein LOC130053499 [Ostrea edulis]